MPADPEIVQFIKEYAASKGIDPGWAVRVASTEGLNVFDKNRPDHGGDGGSSFGVFQLHYGGVNPKMAAYGLGDEFTRKTGLNARDPSTWKEQVKFALDVAAKDGWRQWYGARDNGIPRWAGIKAGAAGAAGGEIDTASGRYDPRRDTPSPGRPTGEAVSNYALQHPVGPEGDDVTTSPYNTKDSPYSPYKLPDGTSDNPFIVKEKAKNPFEKVGAAVAKMGDVPDRNTLGGIQNVPNPQMTTMPPISSVDPASSNNQRNALIAALMKLNSGQLWPNGQQQGGGGIG